MALVIWLPLHVHAVATGSRSNHWQVVIGAMGRDRRASCSGDSTDITSKAIRQMARAEASMAGCRIVSATGHRDALSWPPRPSGWRADGAPSALSARSNALLGRSARRHVEPDRTRTEPVAGEHGWASPHDPIMPDDTCACARHVLSK